MAKQACGGKGQKAFRDLVSSYGEGGEYRKRGAGQERSEEKIVE